MSKIANDIRVGNIIEHQGKNWKVLKTDHVKPGKGGAFVQVEMKEIKQGTKLNERFRSTETINTAHFEEKKFQYLFESGEIVTLMDNTTFEQVEVNKDMFDGRDVFLDDGMEVILEEVAGEFTAAKLPNHVVAEIGEAEAVVKGQTAASGTKPAFLTNGIKVSVPQFIEVGDKVVIHTEDYCYVKRAD